MYDNGRVLPEKKGHLADKNFITIACYIKTHTKQFNYLILTTVLYCIISIHVSVAFCQLFFYTNKWKWNVFRRKMTVAKT